MRLTGLEGNAVLYRRDALLSIVVECRELRIIGNYIPNGGSGTNDIHLHAAEPINDRLSIINNF